eukprot:6421982-Pyramimonas_sp.AAC.1
MRFYAPSPRQPPTPRSCRIWLEGGFAVALLMVPKPDKYQKVESLRRKCPHAYAAALAANLGRGH